MLVCTNMCVGVCLGGGEVHNDTTTLTICKSLLSGILQPNKCA